MILSVCILIMGHSHKITWFSSIAVRCGVSRLRSGVLWPLYGPSMARPMKAVLFYGASYERSYGAYGRPMARSMARSMSAYVYGLWIRGGCCMGGLSPLGSTAGVAFYGAAYGPFYGPSMEAPGGAPMGLVRALYGAFERSMGPPGHALLWFFYPKLCIWAPRNFECAVYERSMAPFYGAFYGMFYGVLYGLCDVLWRGLWRGASMRSCCWSALLACSVRCAVAAQGLEFAQNSREFCKQWYPMGSISRRNPLFCCPKRFRVLSRELSRDSSVAAAEPLPRGRLVSVESLPARSRLRCGVCRRCAVARRGCRFAPRRELSCFAVGAASFCGSAQNFAFLLSETL